MSGLAQAWITSNETGSSILRSAEALWVLDIAMSSLVSIIFYGATFVIYGFAVVSSDLYPRWLGWAATVLGGGAILPGIVMAILTEDFKSNAALTQSMLLVSGVVYFLLAWAFILGGSYVATSRPHRNVSTRAMSSDCWMHAKTATVHSRT